MDFLHYLDVAIGFALGMVVLSTLIGAAAQGLMAWLRTRATYLQSGLTAVVRNLGVSKKEDADQLIQAILQNHNLETSRPWGTVTSLRSRFVHWFGGATANTIDREELVLLLLRMASEDATALALTGLKKEAVAGKLQEVHKAIAEHEAADPGAPAHVWRTRALAAAVPELAGQVFGHFDDVMDRVEDNVTAFSKWTSSALALVFLAVYPVNSFDMLHRLSENEVLRADLVKQAQGLSPGQTGALNELAEKVKTGGLFGQTFSQPPGSLWRETGLAGVILTWVLVSLGGPFWLRTMAQLVGLRSEMARKVSDQRDLRERAYPGAPQSSSPPTRP